MGGGMRRWGNMKYVFKCVTPRQDLAGNMYALENGNDLLFKEVAKRLERQSISKQKGGGGKKNWKPKHVSPIQAWVLTDSQHDWIYSIRKHRSLLAWAANMLAWCFIFSHLEVMCVWALVIKKNDTHTHTHTHKSPLSGVFEKGRLIIPHFVCLCEKAPRSLVGVWPDVFPVVLYCRMWWRELCPMVVVLARAPLTRWLRRWNMLIKPKTTNKNLHQIVTLVVSGATVRFIYGETCPCRHACSSVRVRWYLRVVCVCGPWICVMRPASWCWCSLSDRLTRAVISAACLWQSLN